MNDITPKGSRQRRAPNRGGRPLRVLALTLALSLSFAPQAGAVGINPGSLSQLGGVWDFVKQVNDWTTSLKDLIKIKDDLFNSVNIGDLGGSLAKMLGDAGVPFADINAAAKNIGDIIGQYDKTKGQIEALRSKLTSGTNDFLNGFMNGAKSFEKTTNMVGTLGLAPDLAMKRTVAEGEILSATDTTGANLQNKTDAAAAMVSIKETVDKTNERAGSAAVDAQSLTLAAQGVQSTREGVQLLVRAQAEQIMSSAYNATATTTALSQLAMQSQVTNNYLSQMAKAVVDERVANGYLAIQQVKAAQIEAQQAGSQVASVMQAAASGMNSAFNVGDASDPSVMFP